MSKFKVGDKVKIIKPTTGWHHKVGWVGKIYQEPCLFPIFVKFIKNDINNTIHGCPYREKELELCDPQLLLFEV